MGLKYVAAFYSKGEETDLLGGGRHQDVIKMLNFKWTLGGIV